MPRRCCRYAGRWSAAVPVQHGIMPCVHVSTARRQVASRNEEGDEPVALRRWKTFPVQQVHQAVQGQLVPVQQGVQRGLEVAHEQRGGHALPDTSPITITTSSGPRHHVVVIPAHQPVGRYQQRPRSARPTAAWWG